LSYCKKVYTDIYGKRRKISQERTKETKEDSKEGVVFLCVRKVKRALCALLFFEK
jgi:hypothetical protein